MAINSDSYELIGGTVGNSSSSATITKWGEIESIFHPCPPANSRSSIQAHLEAKWGRVWSTFYGLDIQNYLEFLQLLPYPLAAQGVDKIEHFRILRLRKEFYEFGVYPWLKSWFSFQAEPTGEPVQAFRDNARRIKIRFELAEILFNHPQIDLGWNYSPEINYGSDSPSEEWRIFSSPGHVGFISEIACCREWLIRANVVEIPGVPREPWRQGKREAIRTPVQQPRQLVNGWNDLLQNLHKVLEGTARELVSNRGQFKNFDGKNRMKDLLEEYDNIRCRMAWRADKSDEYQWIWVETDGSVHTTRKGFNVPKPSRKKRKK